MEFVSKSEKDTFDLAAKIAAETKPGDILALFGDLGSGKTTFAKGFAKALGVEKTITSPTFVILKKYSVNGEKIKQLFHLDCYRLHGPEDAEAIGLNEYLKDNSAVFLIEWPEKIWPLVDKKSKKITFTYINENERKISL